MFRNTPDEKRHRRREQEQRRIMELRERFMDLSTKWTLLRQHFLITMGIQPPNEDETPPKT